MTKYEARFSEEPAFVVTNLVKMGFIAKSPINNKITAFRNSGEEVTSLTEEKVLSFICAGNNVLLWRDKNSSFFVGTVDGKLIGYFDGFSSSEQDQLVAELKETGLVFTVCHELEE